MPKQASNQPYGVEGRFARKTDVEEYVRRVKEKNPNGVVVCIDTEEGTHENVNELINDKNFELKEESFEDAGFRETDVQGIDDDSSISAD